MFGINSAFHPPPMNLGHRHSAMYRFLHRHQKPEFEIVEAGIAAVPKTRKNSLRFFLKIRPRVTAQQ